MKPKRKDDELWKVTRPRILLSTPVMNVLTSEVVCKRNGKSKDFHRLDFSSWVNIVAVTQHQEIVFIRQYRFGSGQLEVEIPGGAVEKDEDPLIGGLRELLEETGYSGENGRIIGKVCPNPAIQDNFCYTVLVENVKKTAEPHLDDMEDIEVFTIKSEELPELMRNGFIEHGLVLNALTFYAMSIPDFFNKSKKS
jgi:8-oxo-dGTP pyrophosphatase MutT (NUDIX family)